MPAVSDPFCILQRYSLPLLFLLSLSSFYPPLCSHPRAPSLVDKPAGELIVTYMDLITLSITFGGPAFSDPWLIVVVIFQSLTAAHMLQTNPKAPTKPQWQVTHSLQKGQHAPLPGPHPQSRCWPVPVWALTPRGREAVGLPSGTSAWDGLGRVGRRERTLLGTEPGDRTPESLFCACDLGQANDLEP